MEKEVSLHGAVRRVSATDTWRWGAWGNQQKTELWLPKTSGKELQLWEVELRPVFWEAENVGKHRQPLPRGPSPELQ